jgi:hypothetical protein
VKFSSFVNPVSGNFGSKTLGFSDSIGFDRLLYNPFEIFLSDAIVIRQMQYFPIENSRLHEIVVQLYLEEWHSSVRKAALLVDANEATQFVTELTKSKGWRERVVAAKIICAFDLDEFIAPLVHTFVSNPENYTAEAFSRLISSSTLPDKDALLSEMQKACPTTPYDNHLLEVIENASTNESK